MKKYLNYSSILKIYCLVMLNCIIAFLADTVNAQLITLSAPTTGIYSSNSRITLSPGFSTTGPFHAFITSNLNLPMVSLPSADQNYVRIRTARKQGAMNLTNPTVNDLSEQIQYYDGLGRPIQTVQTMASSLGNDVIQPIEYDNKGRQTIQYLPYAEQGGNGSYRASALTNQAQFYGTSGWDANVIKTTAPYSQSVLELSPLNRLIEQGSAGVVWQPDVSRTTTSGRTVIISYGSNNTSTSYGTTGFGVRLWSATPVGGITHQRILSTNGLYASGQLSLTITKNENWISTDGKTGTTEEYTDSEGHVVLKRTFKSSTDILSTYYVYDDLGNLNFILPPASNPDADSISQTVLDQFCFQYRYDERGRLIEKRVPSSDGWTTYVYNLLNQVVFSQDTLERLNQKTSFTKYDGLGRVIMTGIGLNSIQTRELTQYVVNNWPGNWEYRDNAGFQGYSNASPPTSILDLDVEMVNYYDDYNIPGIPDDQSASHTNKTKGLLTASKVKVLGTSDYLWTVNYYDEEGRLVKQYKQHYLSGIINAANYDEIVYTYDFAGEVTESTRIHRKGASNTTIANRYEYDHMGRRLRNYEKINSDLEVLLSDNNYNEIGQLKSKSLHNGLQKTNYSYNERGWAKSSSSAQFSFQLNYQDGSTPQYNGNISEQHWGAGNVLDKNFIYSYDPINRLTSGIGTGMSETITYDPMGNIQTLNRDGVTRNYFYNGNRLNYTTGASGTGTYKYDANGNVIYDGRLGQAVTMNRLNLPLALSGLGLTFTYDADGRKIKKTSGEVVTDYIDGIQYSSGNISLIQTEEGIARANGASYSYEYDLTDNLGNVRYTFYKNPVTGLAERLQNDDYYPFGLRKFGNPISLNNKYLYTGKELQDELGQYDYGARFYDPIIGRWNAVDPADQFADITPYGAMANNPILYRDPDGRIIPALIVAALVGGGINLAATLISHHGHISFKQGLLSFGVGAVAGVVGFSTGGAALAASGFAAESFVGGAVSALGATAYASPILGLGNFTNFGTPYSIANFASDMTFSALTGGVLGGVSAPKGASFWTGVQKNPLVVAGPVFSTSQIEKLAVNPEQKSISQFSNLTTDNAVDYAVQNKSIHVFGKAAHNLDPLVKSLGSQENVFRAVLNAANGKLPASGVFKDIVVNIAGYDVYIRGSVINGIPKIGTMFIKK